MAEGRTSLGPNFLQRIRTLVAILFHDFGIHCATHQIRLILISSIVITSLFYPALSIYSSSPAYSILASTSRVLDSFLAANAVSSFYPLHDLRNIWEWQAILLRDDALSRAQCGVGRTLRIERILLQRDPIDEGGALNKELLLATLQLEHRIVQKVSQRGSSCLRTPGGECFVLSPLAFWHHNEEELRVDTNVLDTFRLASNVSVAGIPITSDMVMTGREHIPTHLDFADFLALTFLFVESDCLDKTGHDQWIHAVRTAAPKTADLVTANTEPTLIALEYDNKLSKKAGASALSVFLYSAYLSFFVYVSISMRRMNAVHSRVGLLFTALVEIAVSTITSLSVLALVGIKVTMVPWALLPIAIVFVGAENMISLIDAVVKTSVTLPVKERIAEGLSKAGTSNTFKVVSYNSILGVISVFSSGAIRQFCIFAIVVLVAHWFLAHTFFLAVLSIDIQRLELEELIRQNPNLTPAVPVAKHDSRPSSTPTRMQKFFELIKGLLKGRARTNISLVMLLAITATLYLTTRPSVHVDINLRPSASHDSLSRHNANFSGSDARSQAWHFWKIVNPAEDRLVHLRVEMPSMVTFMAYDATDRTQSMEVSSRVRSRFSMRTFRLLVWLIKIVVLPIAATTTTLYGFMLYLLKDAELLEAQRNRGDHDIPPIEEEVALAGKMSLHTLPRVFASDVELIAANKDGTVFAVISLENELVIWRSDSYNHIVVDASGVLLQSPSTSAESPAITSVAVDDGGGYCAVGTTHGVVGIWVIGEESATSCARFALERPSAVMKLLFVPAQQQSPSSLKRDLTLAGVIDLITVFENCTAAKWTVGTNTSAAHIVPTRPDSVTKCLLSAVHEDDRLLVGFADTDGSLQLVEFCDDHTMSSRELRIQPGNPDDQVTTIHACRIRVDDRYHVVIAAATEAGVVSLWDSQSGEYIGIVDDTHGPIDQLRIIQMRTDNCRFCGELPLYNFGIALSTGHVLFFYRVYVASHDRHCSCAGNVPRQRTARDLTKGRRSRSSSMASSSGGGGPNSQFLALPKNSASSTSDFPVSGHGVHSRRASEKDLKRRSSENFGLSVLIDDYELSHPVGPLDFATLRTSLWKTVTIVKCGSATCERGGWDVVDGRVIGVRRRSRTQKGLKHTKGPISKNPASNPAPNLVVLDRWELWMFDPRSSQLQSSPLSALGTKSQRIKAACTPGSHSSDSSEPHSPRDEYQRLPFTRISPFIICKSHAFAGFGNAVGLFILSPS